jgi:hypothetical protein
VEPPLDPLVDPLVDPLLDPLDAPDEPDELPPEPEELLAVCPPASFVAEVVGLAEQATPTKTTNKGTA